MVATRLVAPGPALVLLNVLPSAIGLLMTHLLRVRLHRPAGAALPLAETVPLERELEAVRGYLALEAARFEERLRVRIEVPEMCLRAPVPALLVQTLVENGIKHGVARRAQGGEIALIASLRDGA